MGIAQSPGREESLAKEPLSPASGELDVEERAEAETSSPHAQLQPQVFSVDVGTVGGVVQVPSLPGASGAEKPRNFCFLLEDSVLVCSVGDRLLACRVRDGRLLGYIHTHSQITSLSKAYSRRSELAPAPAELGPAELDRVVVCGCADGSLVSYAIMDSESLERRTDTWRMCSYRCAPHVDRRYKRSPKTRPMARGARSRCPRGVHTHARAASGTAPTPVRCPVTSARRPRHVQARPTLRQSSVYSTAGAGA